MSEGFTDTTKYGVVLAVLKDRQLYMSQRTENVTYPKKWNVISGMMKADEQSIDAVDRMLGEQMLIKAEKKRFHFVESLNTVTNELFYVYLLNLNPLEIPSDTKKEYRNEWRLFSVKKAMVLDVVPGIRNIVRNLFRAEFYARTEETDKELRKHLGPKMTRLV